MSTILGLDLGKFKSLACLYDTDTTVARFTTIPTDPADLRKLLEAERPGLVVFETGTVAGWVADTCAELEVAYAVANPMHEAWSWRKVKRKTDRDDALKLARMAALGELATVPMPSKAAREYRASVQYRDRLVGRRTAAQNRIRALCQRHGVLLPAGHRAWTRAGLEPVAALAKSLGDCGPEELWRGELALERREPEALTATVEEAERRLDALGASDERVKRLRTIPGVGPRTAEVVAYLDDAKRFRTARGVSAYAGLVPRQFQSGETDRRGRITRRGPGLLRKAPVEAAWLMLRYNAWAARTLARIGKGQETRRKQALVAVARKLLVRCWAMLKHGTAWDERLAAAG
ncbi:MAG TPA: IS110 family transposase [Isosphaeraceae bacterium]|jgi:transposase|nr:IS110 family transposase [Isosphaeraceae bacterium]